METEQQQQQRPPAPQGQQQQQHPPQRIGRYQIIKTLGEGSFGKVKLAYHMAIHARVALKIINRKTLAKSDMQGRVEREISYLRLLRHPHIIKLYDVIKSKDEIIMVIEFAGNELFEYIVQRGPMPEKEARRFFQQIISAVEYCHRHKIVHRDLKPENLLLDEDLNVKIADFGLSNIMTDGNFLKTSCGSPNYAAPEVISGKLYAGPEVDVWSCGVILYVMLCGRLPFDDEFIPVLFKKISNGVYTLPNFLSPGAKHLLQRMLVVDPLNRITVAEIMDDPWFKVDIPDYLLPEATMNETDDAVEIDDELVTMLSKTMGYDKEQIYDSLKRDSGEGGEIRDAFKLLKDNQTFRKNTKFKRDTIDQYMTDNGDQGNGGTSTPRLNTPSRSSSGVPQPFGKGNTPALTFDNSHLAGGYDTAVGLSTPNTTIAVLPSSLPAYHRANMEAYGPSQMKKLNPISTKKSKTRWHFGIRSRSYPLDVMGEIYRALKNLGAEWARPPDDDLWTIHVRWKIDRPQQDSPETAPKPADELMKMRIQLYQLEQNNYLVDFKFDGWEGDSRRRSSSSSSSETAKKESDTFSAYPFLHLATRLIMELAVNSQAA
ncbi:carbon catabolite-derepressing protein kinase [Trichomonascus vanleenenianus]|uniref:AMP-activated serine/threonine-protein kinase catalytic subunit SNF1 n=1 Tax=Trichomonascus vanleenenianus TaxID=2268995 RepID=UPI003ECBA22F